MLKFHDIRQNSDDWNLLRAGKITSSSLACVMANFGKSFGDPAKRYAVEIAVEQLTRKKNETNSFGNSHTERGHAQEPIACMKYEQDTFSEVLNGGFFEDEDRGASPDGRVGENGLIEIKSAIPSIHMKRIESGTYDAAYKWQIIGNLQLAQREWIDFISYCSDFPADQQLYVRRVYAEDCRAEMRQINDRLDEFRNLIEANKQRINNAEMISYRRAA